MSTVTISKKEYDLLKRRSTEYLRLTKKNGLIPEESVKDYENAKEITEEYILKLAREATRLHKAGKLPTLRSLKEFR